QEIAEVRVRRHCEERKRRSNPFFLCAAAWIASLTFAMTVDVTGCLKFLSRQLAPRCARGGTVGEASMAGAIGQAFDRQVAAETEILGSRRADRPAASLVTELEQRAAVFVADRLIISKRLRLGVDSLQHLILQ